jgi:hypothetical protein
VPQCDHGEILDIVEEAMNIVDDGFSGHSNKAVDFRVTRCTRPRRIAFVKPLISMQLAL